MSTGSLYYLTTIENRRTAEAAQLIVIKTKNLKASGDAAVHIAEAERLRIQTELKRVSHSGFIDASYMLSILLLFLTRPGCEIGAGGGAVALSLPLLFKEAKVLLLSQDRAKGVPSLILGDYDGPQNRAVSVESVQSERHSGAESESAARGVSDFQFSSTSRIGETQSDPIQIWPVAASWRDGGAANSSRFRFVFGFMQQAITMSCH